MHTQLKIAYSKKALDIFGAVSSREIVGVEDTDFTDVAAAVITTEDEVDGERIAAFEIPLFLIASSGTATEKMMGRACSIIDLEHGSRGLYLRQIESAAERYEKGLLPPFFKNLVEYVARGNSQFDCPGHQGGDYFRKHPAGRLFYDFYGENTFRADLCNADVDMGDLLIHEGPALEAQKNAARVFHADKAYFVLNGTSGANKIVLTALLAPGDLVLYERNNHKSVSFGALTESGATPIYLETARNPFGLIGGILEHCFNEEYIRMLIAEKDPKKAKAKRPIRLAVIQLGTYDGCVYNARQVVDKIGHLCDYIFFDSAWVGYEQFIPMMKDCSPLLLDLGPDDPGIFVSQSVHKQQAGFSQASQILKKDGHIRGQERYVPHKRFNNSFLRYASTSSSYQIFASLDMNARMQDGEAGKWLWRECIRIAIEARKSVLKHCRYVRPIVPPAVRGKRWEEWDTDVIADDLSFFAFVPGGKWHSFLGYGKGQYFIDPCKFQLTTPGIDMESGEYENFGIPAVVLAQYLRENGIIPEKYDLNDILFLMTPAETKTKMDNLITKLLRFEQLIDEDVSMEKVLPGLYRRHAKRYKGYTIRRLCGELHDFYKERKVNVLQRNLFLKKYLPEYVMNPQKANFELIRGRGELVPLEEAEGRMAMEGSIPYPPSVICVQPGERWTKTAVDYFLCFIEGMNQLPGFEPEMQGVYVEHDAEGRKRGMCSVLKIEYEP